MMTIEQNPEVVESLSSSSKQACTPKACRLWLTDDNVSFRHTLADLLARGLAPGQAFNCERQFLSAEQLLEALATNRAPDVILLDVEMGGMSGVDALPKIRELAPQTRVLIVTSFYDPIYDARAAQGGAMSFLLKSYTAQRIATEVETALQQPLRELSLPPAMPVTARLKVTATARRNWLDRLSSWMSGLPKMTDELPYPRATAAK